MWPQTAAWPRILRRCGHGSVVAVEPCREAALRLQAELGLRDPSGVAHDGWLRYTGQGLQLYRGLPHLLTKPVLSLAGRLGCAVDPWGLLPPGGEVLALALAAPCAAEAGAEAKPAGGGPREGAAAAAGEALDFAQLAGRYEPPFAAWSGGSERELLTGVARGEGFEVVEELGRCGCNAAAYGWLGEGASAAAQGGPLECVALRLVKQRSFD
jgi:hypothetical protein